MKRLSTFFLALTVILFIGGCDSNGSDPGDGNDGVGDTAEEISFWIRVAAANSGLAVVEYSFECYDAEGDQTGRTGSGTVVGINEMCTGFGIAIDATYADGSSPIDVQVVDLSAEANDENVLAVETLQDHGDETSFRLGTAPGS